MNEDPRLLAAGYALGTLTEEELAVYRAYLASSPAAQAEADEFDAIAAALGMGVASATPPASLKDSIMGKLADVPRLAPVQEAETAPEPPTRAEAKAQRRWFAQPLGIILSAAAAVLVFVAGTFVGVGISQGNNAREQQASALAELNAATDAQRAVAQVSGGGTATLVWSQQLGKSALLVDGLQPLPSGKTYELWYIGDAGPVPAGTMSAAKQGTTWRVLEGTYSPGDKVGVTVEPDGGSEHPTTQPVVVIKS